MIILNLQTTQIKMSNLQTTRMTIPNLQITRMRIQNFADHFDENSKFADYSDDNSNFADYSDEAVLVVSLLLASLATVVNVAIEVHHLISSPTASSPQFIWSWLCPLLLLLHKRRWWQRRWWVKTTLALASYSSTLVQGTLSLSSWIRIYLYHFWYSWSN